MHTLFIESTLPRGKGGAEGRKLLSDFFSYVDQTYITLHEYLGCRLLLETAIVCNTIIYAGR